MNDPVKEYYKTIFVSEYLRIRKIGDNSLSIASISPDKQIKNDREAEIFQSFPFKPLFLLCFFFHVLFDQAMHSSLREEHFYIDKLTRPLKFCGILSIAAANLHPAYLIMMATLYMNSDEKEITQEHFKKLTDYFLDDYENMILIKYPLASGDLHYFDNRKKALLKLLRTIKDATKRRPNLQLMKTFTDHSPDYVLYSEMMEYFSSKIDDKIFEVDILSA